MNQRKKGFTLIELIIVVVIVGILALIAIPRYFANVAKATKSQVYANLDAIRQAQLSYYAAYGVYHSGWPIVVVIDGDTIMNLDNLSNANWRYSFSTTAACTARGSYATYAYKLPGDSCYYALCTDGYPYQSCTP